jgi:hypothetical protein
MEASTSTVSIASGRIKTGIVGRALENMRRTERDDPVSCFRWYTYTFDVSNRGPRFVKRRNYH